MTPERWQDIRRAFAAIDRVDAERRLGELHRRFGHDPELVAEVESLLAERDAADAEGFLVTPPDEPTEDADDERLDDSLPPGARIGPYAIERVLGQGGMGAVYLASRVEDYEQRVALKLIHAPMAPAALRRFHAERQLLAQLVHPHIVRLLDGGTAEGGAPYLVMEYIAGVPLDEHCDRGRLTPAARARLLHLVAQAVAYAHDQGIVHRDLKPANILVTPDGTPKVTDFGLARAARPGQPTTLTGRGMIPGTPDYMAPEQFRGPGRNLPAVDCYSLGAILYRLLTGHAPFEAETSIETCIRVATEEPVAPRRLNRAVTRDLDTIARKALATDPAERFATAGDLAEQLRRFLGGEPLTIPPRTPWTWLGKWAARHRAGLLAWGASVVLLLAIMVGVLAEQNRRIHRSEAATRELLGHVSRASEDLLQGMPPGSERTHSYYENMAGFYESALERAGPEADVLLRRRAALMHHNLARSSVERSYYGDAVAHFGRAIALLRPLPALALGRPEHPWIRFDLFRCLQGRSYAHAQRGERAGAVADGEEALRVVSELVRDEPGNPNWLSALGNQHKDLANLSGKGLIGDRDAERHAQEAVGIAHRVRRMEPENPQFLINLHWAHLSLGSVHQQLERIEQAEAEYRAAVDAAKELVRLSLGDWDARSAHVDALKVLAGFLIGRGRHAEAEGLLVAALETSGPLVATYPRTDGYVLRDASLRIALGAAQHATGRTIAAEATYRQAIALLDGFYRARPGHAEARNLLAQLYEDCPVATLRDPSRARMLRTGRAEGPD